MVGDDFGKLADVAELLHVAPHVEVPQHATPLPAVSGAIVTS